MRTSFMAAILTALTIGFVFGTPADATARNRKRPRSNQVSSRSGSRLGNDARSSAKKRSGRNPGASTRRQVRTNKRVFKTYTYRIIPGGSSGSFSPGPASSGSGRYSTSEYLVWPNGN